MATHRLCVQHNVKLYSSLELVELIVQELEIKTDEKLVVNPIIVFQGVESLGSAESFATVV
ncbi:hypothetical protein SDRG_07941 [Saprolegnia diclina VS20]|uniref:Uncharacterized protein n=1 Tax=Saprolegnia diclina (strain VS20) TaxID=1156394 RepID=T0Q9P4_SAPDV|nr:hypothetical protein SDRG_07941 [Saprolegnia diclina VS20]EQC34619.1 hypothetical protein SDRG_07941 [Saprolegnia diclina VS20]|eukprot:XP_008612025.1 hypothetical protein SDRG_07941 [Saprolegnia diclina VS20]